MVKKPDDNKSNKTVRGQKNQNNNDSSPKDDIHSKSSLTSEGNKTQNENVSPKKTATELNDIGSKAENPKDSHQKPSESSAEKAAHFGQNSPKQKDVKHPETKPNKTKLSQNPLETRGNQKAKRIVNIFTIIILLLIVGAIYMYQKGYIRKDYPSANSNSSNRSPIGTSGLEETFTDTDNNTPIESKEQFSNPNQRLMTNETMKDLPSLSQKRSPQGQSNSPNSALGQQAESDETTSRVSLSTNQMQNELIAQTKRIETLESKLRELGRDLEEQSSSLKDFAPQHAMHAEKEHLIYKAKFLNVLALQDLTQKIHQGLPFERELIELQRSIETYKSLLQSLTASNDATKFTNTDLDQALQTLKALSQIGVPSLTYLIENYRPLETTRQNHLLFHNATSFWDRVVLFFKQLIVITPVKDNQNKQSLGPMVSKDIALLRQGRVADVAEKIISHSNAKPNAKLSPEESLWLTHAVAYVDSHKALGMIKKVLADL